MRQAEQDGGKQGLLDAAGGHGGDAAVRRVLQEGTGMLPGLVGDLAGQDGRAVAEEAQRPGGRAAQVGARVIGQPPGRGGDDQAAPDRVGSHPHGLVVRQQQAAGRRFEAPAVAVLDAHGSGRGAQGELAGGGRGVDDDAGPAVADPHQVDGLEGQAVDHPVQRTVRDPGLEIVPDRQRLHRIVQDIDIGTGDTLVPRQWRRGQRHGSCLVLAVHAADPISPYRGGTASSHYRPRT